MVLDPLSAIGLAGNIIQFIDFTTGLVGKGREIYTSTEGASIENLEIETITRHLIGQVSRLTKFLREDLVTAGKSNEALKSSVIALESLSESCVEVANDLIRVLENIKIKGPHRRWQSFRQALKTSWSEKKINGLLVRISRFKDELSLHLTIILR